MNPNHPFRNLLLLDISSTVLMIDMDSVLSPTTAYVFIICVYRLYSLYRFYNFIIDEASFLYYFTRPNYAVANLAIGSDVGILHYRAVLNLDIFPYEGTAPDVHVMT